MRDHLRTVRGQIEQNKSQLQRWDKDVDLATVTVKLLDRRDYSPPLMPDFGSTVGRTFRGSIEALVSFGKGILLVVVALAPWLAVLGLFVAPVWLIWRRRRVADIAIPEAIPQAEEQSAAPRTVTRKMKGRRDEVFYSSSRRSLQSSTGAASPSGATDGRNGNRRARAASSSGEPYSDTSNASIYSILWPCSTP